MSKSFQRKCTSVLAFFAILVLGAIITIVWVQFGQGSFKSKPQYQIFNVSNSVSSTEPVRVFNRTRVKEYIEKTHLGDVPGSEIEFVKPLRIMPAPDYEEEPEKPIDKLTLRRHGGHFRHKSSETWDRHPHYEIKAFGRKLYLELDYNDKFISPNLHIVHHFHPNVTQKVSHDQRLTGCYYTGKIRGDKESSVIVSLCGGMTGYIHTSENSYFIEPAEVFTNTTKGSVTHRITKVPHPNRDSNDINSAESAEFFENNENRTIISDSFYPEGMELTRGKREIPKGSGDEGVVGTCNAIQKEEWQMFNNEQRTSRRPRNAEWNSVYRINNESFVEVLIVADRSMIKYHSVDDLEHYILTLMAHVDFLYKHETIGNAITIIPSIVIRNHHTEFSKMYSEDMLLSFCNWTKQNINNSDSYDVAILLTRNVICKDNNTAPQNCLTLGVGEVGSMCQRGCAVVRDKGLASSYVIAHELGHVLNMPHDNDTRCAKFNKNSKTTYIMADKITHHTKPFTWSPCSQHYLTEFLRSQRAHCLRNPPISNYIYTDVLPGDRYDLNAQCKLEFGHGFHVCPHALDLKPCEHLSCTTGSGSVCHFTYSPWADGTKCGARSICYNGECRLEQEFVPINGGWGLWQPWENCTRPCGGGIKKSQRFCDSPKPINGGTYCTGESMRYESCNTQDCDVETPDFRYQQCAEFNDKISDSSTSTNITLWYPHYNIDQPEEMCKLNCVPNNMKAHKKLKDKVIDGTKCGRDGFGICVDGVCKPGGCDNKLDSKATLDDCGICGGDNSKCQEINGKYNKPGESDDYYRVTIIPKGSSNINITQDSYPIVDQNYLVLIDGETGEFLLNGNHNVNNFEYLIKFGNVEITYSGSGSTVESITSPKNQKLRKDLIVEVLTKGKMSPPKIHYRYVINKEDAPMYPRYYTYLSNARGFARSYGWRLYEKQWSKCNSICDGKQFRKPVCVDLITGTEVPKDYCDNTEDMQIQKQECNTHCELTWSVVSKSACNPACGKGIRRIHYNCMKVYKKKPNYSEIVDARHCYVLAKPPMQEACHTACNSTRWHYSPWSKCSKSCGGGLQKRTAKCIDDSYTHIDDSYCKNSEMITEQICNADNCPTWNLVKTSSCSASCGGGYRNLTYECAFEDGRVYEDACDIQIKPSSKEPCNEHSCGKWSPTNSYGHCSVTCGEGIEKRIFVCKKFDSNEIVDDNYCENETVPNEVRVCYMYECSGSKLDDFENVIVPQYGYYKSFQWVPGDWSGCSQSCGGGIMRQLYRCLDNFGNENNVMCKHNQKPDNTKQCNVHACPPRWKTGNWSPTCNSNCERLRQVRCLNDSNAIVDDNQCDKLRRPSGSMKCKKLECPPSIPNIFRFSLPKNGETKRFRWKVGQWKRCSNTCGKGMRRRNVVCEDTLNNAFVVEQFCLKLKKPKDTRACEKYACKYAWMESYWSACSKTCNSGIKTRNVTCHRVHKGGILDPVPLPNYSDYKNVNSQNYCSLENKPSTVAKCLLSYCGDEYMWQPDPWKECTHKCGRKGRQTRILNCVSVRNKEKVPRYMCRKNLKPPRKRKCNQHKCVYRSCREIKHYAQTKENKDYVISLRGRPVLIYCYKMDTPYPQEYISLHPDKLNYAEIYHKRLLDIESCPYNGMREERCPCDDVGQERSGRTQFWKVRLNITSMTIVGDDYTFSKQIRGSHVPYGSGGDCYSTVQGCAQGGFSIDLTFTSFKLSSSVKWEKLGSYASMFIHKLETSATGKCGGYCGNCIPDADIGLAVEIT